MQPIYKLSPYLFVESTHADPKFFTNATLYVKTDTNYVAYILWTIILKRWMQSQEYLNGMAIT